VRSKRAIDLSCIPITPAPFMSPPAILPLRREKTRRRAGRHLWTSNSELPTLPELIAQGRRPQSYEEVTCFMNNIGLAINSRRRPVVYRKAKAGCLAMNADGLVSTGGRTSRDRIATQDQQLAHAIYLI